MISKIEYSYFFCVFIGLFTLHPAYANKVNFQPQAQLAAVIPKDIENYLVSEKLDGVRGYWNGRKMLSRSGMEISLPNWFIKDFPSYSLDGELWIGRGKFEEISALVRQFKASNKDWMKVKFMVFDSPKLTKPFESRYLDFNRELSNLSPFLQVIPQKEFNSKEEIIKEFTKIISINGEGLMLHHKKAMYQYGKNSNIIKLKPYFDAEAKVIEHLSGNGKYQGMLGALKVEMPNGKVFKIGSGFSDKDRLNPPPIGSLITYRYHGLTKNGIPRFARYLRVRNKDI